MIAVLLTFTLAVVAVLSPSRTLFAGTAALLTGAYLFASNIPLEVFGVEEFIRYSKEPLIIAVLGRFMLSAWRRQLLAPQRLGAMPSSQPQIWTNVGRGAFVVLIAWSAVSLYRMGAPGIVGYFRGVIFPAVVLLYLNGIDDTHFRKLGDAIAAMSVLLIAFLALASLAHLYYDPDFLIPESFRNRLDYEAPYRTLVAYGDIRRYQSFFGDPNRMALVCILALWFASVGRTRALRWIVFAVVAYLLWLTQSRSGMLLAGLWGLYLFLRPNPSRYIPIVAMIGSLVAVSGAVVWLSFSTRAGSIEEVSRAVLWLGVGQHIVSSWPVLLLGEGFAWVGQSGGTFVASEAIQLTTASGRTLALNVIDNSYLTILSSLGAIGSLAWFVFYKDALAAMAARLSDRGRRRQFWVLVGLIGMWSLFFDALVSFPWTFLFPLLLRYAAVAAHCTRDAHADAGGEGVGLLPRRSVALEH
jgi:hypothetical protein